MPIQIMVNSLCEGHQSESIDRAPNAIFQIIARDASNFHLQVRRIDVLILRYQNTNLDSYEYTFSIRCILQA